jgi:hypothetical protein
MRMDVYAWYILHLTKVAHSIALHFKNIYLFTVDHRPNLLTHNQCSQDTSLTAGNWTENVTGIIHLSNPVPQPV